MKKLFNYMDNAPYWQVFIASSLFGMLIILGAMKGVGMQLPDTTIKFKIVMAMGAFCGLFSTLTTSMARSSKKFWKMAEVFEKKLDEATTKEELETLFNEEFKAVKSQGSGTPHWNEIHRLNAIIQTKYKYYQEEQSCKTDTLALALDNLQNTVIGLFRNHRVKDYEMVVSNDNGYIKTITIGKLGGLTTLHITADQGKLIMFGDNKTLLDMKKNPYKLQEIIDEIQK